jgi:hypothetical protein
MVGRGGRGSHGSAEAVHASKVRDNEDPSTLSGQTTSDSEVD